MQSISYSPLLSFRSFCLGLGILLIVGARPISANCVASAFFYSGQSPESTRTSYVYTPGFCDSGIESCEEALVSPNFDGFFWSLGGGDPIVGVGDDNGAFGAINWISDVYSSYLYGNWAGAASIDGCIHNGGSDPNNPDLDECMVVLLTDEVGDNSYFALLTDQSDGNSRFFFEGVPVSSDYARIDLVPQPGPIALGGVLTSPTQTDLTLSLPDAPTTPADGAYLDCPGAAAAHGPGLTLVSSYNVYQKAVPRGAPPPFGRDLGGWTLVGSGAPGATVVLPATCAGEEDVYFAVAPELDGGFVTPQVSTNSPSILCGPNPSPGSVPDGSFLAGAQLTIDRLINDDLRLNWGISCSGLGTDYAIYEGTLTAPFDDHVPRRCSTGGVLTDDITPGSGSQFYLVVPRLATEEGGYGFGTGGPRLSSMSACLPQGNAACP